MSWFERLFGFSELSGVPREIKTRIPLFPQLKSHIHSNVRLYGKSGTENEYLESLCNGREFLVGKFSTSSLKELREKAVNLLEAAGYHHGTGGVTFEHIAVKDLIELHSQSDGAVFQAASQFNCLEFASPHAVPELGIEIYESDRTQGPACALACAAGTLYRNYFARVPKKETTTPSSVNGPEIDYQIGQSNDLQINNLDDLDKMLGSQGLWEVVNGYTFSDEAKLEALSRELQRYDLHDLRDVIKIGIQENVEVSMSSLGTFIEADRPIVTVTQLYCSALSCAYSGVNNSSWEPFARLVLEAAYEATLWGAIACPPASAPSGEKRDVYLTFLGGGVFGNDIDWILKAAARAIIEVERNSNTRAALNVKICHYRNINASIVENFQKIYNDLLSE